MKASELEIHAILDNDGRALIRISVIHRETGQQMGGGIIPVWCSGEACDGCDEAHEKGDG